MRQTDRNAMRQTDRNAMRQTDRGDDGREGKPVAGAIIGFVVAALVLVSAAVELYVHLHGW